MIELANVLVKRLHLALSVEHRPINYERSTSSFYYISWYNLVSPRIENLAVIELFWSNIRLHLVISQLTCIYVNDKVFFKLANSDVVVDVLEQILTAYADFSVNDICEEFIASWLLFQTNVLAIQLVRLLRIALVLSVVKNLSTLAINEDSHLLLWVT